MLISLAFFFKSASVTALLFLALGLIEPWWVLWWESTQNRLRVIKFYGAIAIVCYAINILIKLLI